MCFDALAAQGIGHMVLQELESRLAKQGVRRIFLESGATAPARRFYEMSGYKMISLVSLAKLIEA